MRDFLDDLKEKGLAQNNFLGLLHVLIGRRIEKPDGTILSVGQTWREAAAWLKKARWDTDAVRELGLDPAALPPRDRQRFWYAAITHAKVSGAAAVEAGDRLAASLREAGYIVK